MELNSRKINSTICCINDLQCHKKVPISTQRIRDNHKFTRI